MGQCLILLLKAGSVAFLSVSGVFSADWQRPVRVGQNCPPGAAANATPVKTLIKYSNRICSGRLADKSIQMQTKWFGIMQAALAHLT